jgi:acyl-coenzyme A synthetase/AMP-(fatty) acid ligase
MKFNVAQITKLSRDTRFSAENLEKVIRLRELLIELHKHPLLHVVTEQELREFVRSQLAHFKAPRDFTFVPELPKTATGKVQKYVLRKGRSAISVA